MGFEISIHALRMEGDFGLIVSVFAVRISIHALRMEGDRREALARFEELKFQSTPSAWRATGSVDRPTPYQAVFQSTPSAWRATACEDTGMEPEDLFQSTPSAWRATEPVYSVEITGRISIHALRMEGDWLPKSEVMIEKYFNPRPPHGGRPTAGRWKPPKASFQSTPSAWRATGRDHGRAARAGYFNPRPPQGGRLRPGNKAGSNADFNPRPPHGGRPRSERSCPSCRHFNPRPPHGGRHETD